MKCAACGYERLTKEKTVDKVIYYKSGKRKGEIKEVISETISLEVGHSDFIKLEFKKEVDEIGYHTSDWYGYFEDVKLYACPECGTIKIEI